MLRFFLNLFRRPPSKKKCSRRESKNIDSLVQRYASGSIPLQEGRYIAKQDAALLKEQALRYHF